MPRTPVFTLFYEGVNITAEVRSLVTSIELTDKLEGESDDLQIAIDNADLRWMDTWLPGQGDTLTLSLGYEGEAVLGPLSFEIDEPEYSGTPDRLRLKAVATPVSTALRQRNSQSYEDTTLRAIAQSIAARHNLTLVGDVPEIKLDRVTQKEQSDLEFLRETAIEYGLIFKIESASRLVFYRESELENAPAAFTVARSLLTSYQITRGAKGTYKAATVAYQDPESGDFVEVTIDAAGAEVETEDEDEDSAEGGDPEESATPTETEDKNAIASEDVLKVRERTENREQATIKAREALRRANRSQIEGTLQLEGDIRFSAGVNIQLEGFKAFSGKYQITQVNHTLAKTRGYSTSADIKRIDPIAGEQ